MSQHDRHGLAGYVTDSATRAQLRRFIDRRLKSGGLVYVSYNALPGWTGDLPLQHLVRALSPPAATARRGSQAAAQAIDRLAVTVPAPHAG